MRSISMCSMGRLTSHRAAARPWAGTTGLDRHGKHRHLYVGARRPRDRLQWSLPAVRARMGRDRPGTSCPATRAPDQFGARAQTSREGLVPLRRHCSGSPWSVDSAPNVWCSWASVKEAAHQVRRDDHVLGGARGARSGGRRVYQGSSRLPGATAGAVGVAAQPRMR